MKTNQIVGWMIVNQKGQDCSTILPTRETARWLVSAMGGFKGNFRICKILVVH